MNRKTFKNDQARLDKNKQISNTRRQTAEKRKTQTCKTHTLKITHNKLTPQSQESLRHAFLEAKWLRNAALAQGWQNYDYKATTVRVKTPKGIETRTINNLGSQVKQSIIARIGHDINALAAKKDNGYKVGKLKYAKQITCLDLKQAGSTYRIKNNKIKIQGIQGWLRLRGIHQIKGKELANAKLLQKPDGYYLAITTYTQQTKEKQNHKNQTMGLDFGVKTHITQSDGREYNFNVQENERLKRIQRKLTRQVKGSKNSEKTKRHMRIEHQKMTHKRDELANQFVSQLLKENKQIFFQDDNLASWKSKKSLARGGKSLQGSILGRVKSRLDASDQAVKVNRFAPTSKTCICGIKNERLTLGDRFFECKTCGYRAPRDVHAARNMKNFTPAERGAAPVEETLDSQEQSPGKQETIECRGSGAVDAFRALAQT